MTGKITMTAKSMAEQLVELNVMDQLNADPYVKENEDQKSGLRKKFRENLVKSVGEACEITGIRFALVASHIKPFKDCVSQMECVSPANGLMLSRNIDYLFDGGWITFEEDGRLIWSDEFGWREPNECLQKAMPEDWLTGKNKIKTTGWSGRRAGYLSYHRHHVFRSKYCQYEGRSVSEADYSNKTFRQQTKKFDPRTETIAERRSRLEADVKKYGKDSGCGLSHQIGRLAYHELMNMNEVLSRVRKARRKRGIAWVDETNETWGGLLFK